MNKIIADADVKFSDLESLANISGPIGLIVKKLAVEWAEGDLDRLGPDAPRIGTIYAYQATDSSLHIDFVPRHHKSITG